MITKNIFPKSTHPIETWIDITVSIQDGMVHWTNDVSVQLRQFEIVKGERLLSKTGNSEKNWAILPFQKEYIYFDTDVASYLCHKEVSCIGIDYLSLSGRDNSAEVHKLLLTSERVIIEGLNLQGVPPGEYKMICLPLNSRLRRSTCQSDYPENLKHG